MCGVCGFVDPRTGLDPSSYPALIEGMSETLAARGPDGSGHWIDTQAGVALGHRRLAVIDISAAGQQPMTSADGRCVLCYNGEIYNYRALREELTVLGHRFRGTSDTEVLVEALARWGLARTLPRLNGIFAFALWETRAGRMTLARDALGVKPLYWAELDGRLVFGSELKALRAFPHWQPQIDRDAVAAYLRYGYVPAPASIYQAVGKLPAGGYLTWRAAEGVCEGRWFDLGAVAAAAAADPLPADAAGAVDRLEATLGEAVGSQMLADVPLGAFLSGGIDSSTVVALMQARSPRPINTFTIGFADSDYDEAGHARAVARHLGTDHHELYVGPADLLALLPGLAQVYDEPFADASQLPTLLVAGLARSRVTVALSGDGGDELFAGYNRHVWAQRWWPFLARVPQPLRRAAAALLAAPTPGLWQQVGRHLPARLRLPQLETKAAKLAAVLGQGDLAGAYQTLVSQWAQPQDLVIGARAAAQMPDLDPRLPDDLARMQLLDALTYLPDDILVKVDRASMSQGLEARVPLLDSAVVDLAWRLPPRFKQRDGRGKWLLRQVLYRHVPPALIDRPKMGFGVPVDDWLRGPLLDWAAALLDPLPANARELLHPQPIDALWRAHRAGTSNNGARLWVVLGLVAWLNHWH